MSQETAIRHLETLRCARVEVLAFTQTVLERAAEIRVEQLPLETQLLLALTQMQYAELLTRYPDDSYGPPPDHSDAT